MVSYGVASGRQVAKEKGCVGIKHMDKYMYVEDRRN